MPTRVRAIRERRKSLINLLLVYHIPQLDAEYIADKAVERALEGREFVTQIELGLLTGELKVDLRTSVCLICSLKSVDVTLDFSHIQQER
jgi:hypothetical protein